jgi:hypothetical protein
MSRNSMGGTDTISGAGEDLRPPKMLDPVAEPAFATGRGDLMAEKADWYYHRKG